MDYVHHRLSLFTYRNVISLDRVYSLWGKVVAMDYFSHGFIFGLGASASVLFITASIAILIIVCMAFYHYLILKRRKGLMSLKKDSK